MSLCGGAPKEKVVEKIVEKTVEKTVTVEKPIEYIAVHVSHGIPDWEGWYEQYKTVTAKTSAEENPHIVLECKLSFIGTSTTAEGGLRVHVIHLIPKKNRELVSKIFNFDAPPFVGGPDLIKNGIVIPPFEENIYDVDDANFAAMFRANHNLGIFSHGIKEYVDWKTKYYGAQDAEMGGISYKPLLVGSCEEKKKCFVCGIWPVAESEAFEAMMDFDSPDTPVKPFIEAGDIILPMYRSVIEFKAIDRHIR